MEQLLNLLWVSLAIVVVCIWLWHRKHATHSRNDARLIWQLLALSIILLLLFFAISITDDLHWTAIATEAEGARKLVDTLASIVSASAFGIFVASFLLAIASHPGVRKIGIIERPRSIGLPAAGVYQDFSGRSPPLAP